MAASYYLIGILVLAVIVSGQEVGSVAEGNFLCPYCEKAVEEFKQYATSDATLAQVEKLAEFNCEFVPFEFHTQCLDLAKQLPGLIRALAEQYLNPQLACTRVCSAKELTAKVGPVAEGNFLCPYCEKAVEELKQYATSNATLAEVEELVEFYCSFAPSEFHTQCLDLAKQLPGLIKAFAEQYLNPKLACMGVCPAGEFTAKVGSVAEGNFLCPYCEKAVEELKQYATSNATLAEVEQLVEFYCSFAPSVFHTQCLDLAKQLPGLIKAFAEQYLNPELACMEVCPAGEFTAKAAVDNVIVTSLAPLFGKMAGNLKGGFVCVACENGVGLLRNITLNQGVMASAEKFWEGLCVFTPYMYYQNCLDFVKTVPGMIQLFAQEYLNPVKDCADVCPAREPLFQNGRHTNLLKMFQSMKARK
ncbi:uncharacterized protein [Asterias amurensis]|uniref:uncharacterized protein n=1 Tax=Asterias amurensis TaxID=7602 RepID=UPI003AB58CA9